MIELRFNVGCNTYVVTDGEYVFPIRLSKRYMHLTSRKLVEEFFKEKILNLLAKEDIDY